MNTWVIQGVSFIAFRSPQVSRDFPADAWLLCNKAAVLGKTIQKNTLYYIEKEDFDDKGDKKVPIWLFLCLTFNNLASHI